MFTHKQNQLNTTHRIPTSNTQVFKLSGVIALQVRKKSFI